VPAEQVDPIYFARSYYLEPENQAVKPYLLLRDALEESGMYGLVKVAIRNREQLATLRVRDGVIVLETMIWPDEVREAAFPFLDEHVDLRPQELGMAESLVASMAGDFDPDAYSDDYREALQQVIDAKIEGREVVETPQAEPTAGNVVDLMAALRASVEAAKRSRGETATAPAKTEPTKTTEAAKASTKSAPAKKAPAKKAPASKTAAKKAPAKKAAAKATAKSGTGARKATARRRSA
jgi:DNA end-binding protein Ku